MDGRPTWTDCDEVGDYVVPNVLSPRDLVFRPDNMDETVPHTYLTGMRRVHDGVCESICQTVAKRSHGIAKSSHASRTLRERFAKVLNMLYFFVQQKSSQNRRQVITYVANLSPTLRKHIARNFPQSAQCDKYAT